QGLSPNKKPGLNCVQAGNCEFELKRLRGFRGCGGAGDSGEPADQPTSILYMPNTAMAARTTSRAILAAPILTVTYPCSSTGPIWFDRLERWATCTLSRLDLIVAMSRLTYFRVLPGHELLPHTPNMTHGKADLFHKM